MNNFLRKNKSMLFGVLLLAACAGKEVPVTEIPADANPAEQITLLDKQLQEARTKGVHVLSPTWYGKAEASLNDAKETLRKQGKYTDIFSKLEQGHAQLGQAQKYTKISETVLEGVLPEREKALAKMREAQKAGATELGSTFKDAETSFLALTKAVESDNVKYAENNKVDVIQKYRNAAAEADKKRSVDVAKQIIEKAKDLGAKKYAPTALKLAEENVDTTERFVANNPQATEEILKRGTASVFLANRLLNLTKESKALDEREPEQRVAWIENKTTSLNKALNLGDRRDQTFDDQFASIAKSATELHAAAVADGSKVTTAEAELRQRQEELEKSRAQLQKSHAALELDRKFGKVRDMFREDEAEVLREGDRLVVRLKKINFPVGKAQVQQEDFALLNKAQKAIAAFDSPRVTVEGHTDATGSAETNLRLSQQRANIVKEYLLANEAVAASNIEAIGYGFSRPLADNKSAQTRAMNRRFDLVIEPQADAATARENANDVKADSMAD